MARYKLISCNVFQRELCAAIAQSSNVIEPEFLEMGLHESSENLRTRLQGRIDEASAASKRAVAAGGKYDAILLGYGLCGNGLAGVAARSLPLVLARAHDCCTILLGSRAEFLARFGGNLSASWSSAGYVERGATCFRSFGYAELVEKYGEENARYVCDTMRPVMEETQLRYIETAETEPLGYAKIAQAKAAEEGKDFILLKGSSRLLRALVAGSWDEDEFLVVPPGANIVPLYDYDRVIEAK
jgi:hypothetical protein